MALAFEQQPNESDKAFDAFGVYLALGPNRSLAKAAEATGRARSLLARWCRRWKWVARAAAHAKHLSKVEREATESLVRQNGVDWAQHHESIRQQAWKEGEDLIALAQHFKERWRDSDRLPDFGAVLRALELAFKLKQFAAGMPSEVREVNTTVSGPDGGPIRLEVEAALKKIYGQPLPGEVVEAEVVSQKSDMSDMSDMSEHELGGQGSEVRNQRSEEAKSVVGGVPEVKQ